MKPPLLFFDDYPLASENQLFLRRLMSETRRIGIDAGVLQEKSITSLDKRLRTSPYSALILDIMSAVPDRFRSTADGETVKSSVAGLEILRRCREGSYDLHNSNIPVFMRSARGERYISEMCRSLGARGYFEVGIDDSTLIKTLLGVLSDAG